MEFKGTKGKWFSSSLEVISMPTQTKIGKITGNNYDEARFNAILISKAPEMLEMLKDILVSVENSNIPSDIISMEKIEILIKEATEFKNK